MSDLENSQPSSTESTSAESSAPQIEKVSSFLDLISDDSLKSEPSLSSFRDVTNLAKSYVNLNKMMGSSIRIPSEAASPEDRAEFYKKLESVPGVAKLPDKNNPEEIAKFYERLGRPDSPDNYDIKIPSAPEDLVKKLPALAQGIVDPEQLSQYKQLAHTLGLNSEQAQKLLEFDIARQLPTIQAQVQQVEHSREVLKQMWGSDYEARKTATENIVKLYEAKHPELVKEFMNQPNISPLVYHVMSELGKVYQERGAIRENTAKFSLTPEEARAKISEMRSNRSHPLNVGSHPGHKAAMQELDNLYHLAYPSQDNS